MGTSSEMHGPLSLFQSIPGGNLHGICARTLSQQVAHLPTQILQQWPPSEKEKHQITQDILTLHRRMTGAGCRLSRAHLYPLVCFCCPSVCPFLLGGLKMHQSSVSVLVVMVIVMVICVAFASQGMEEMKLHPTDVKMLICLACADERES